MRVLFSEIQL